jgi:hypothetical protein
LLLLEIYNAITLSPRFDQMAWKLLVIFVSNISGT